MTTRLGWAEIARKTIGYQTVQNTQHPIVVTATRIADINGVRWVVTRLCNGSASYSAEYPTRTAAMDDFESQ